MSEPSLPRLPSNASIEESHHPSVVHGIGTNFATYIALFHPLPPVALLILFPGMSLEPRNRKVILLQVFTHVKIPMKTKGLQI